MNECTQEVVDYCLTKGIIKYNTQFKLTHAPISVIPYQIPQSVLDSMVEMTPVYNELMVRVGNDRAFLTEHLQDVAKTDQFINRLLKLQKEAGLGRHLQVSRNDFLLTDTGSALIPKQVEFNTISNSFPYLSTKVNRLHKHLARRKHCPGNLVDNDPLEGVIDAMAEAIKHYGVPDTVMLMIIQPKEQNLFDQRGVEYRLLEKHGIHTIRFTLEQVFERGRIQNGHLIIDDYHVALAYFRAAYTPNDYPDENAWKGRELIEQSDAVKCPSVGMQLAGAKKIQQVLSKPGVVEQFIPSETAFKARENFVAMYELDEEVQGQAAYKLALASPRKYVLKPQREGGGNNLYEEEMMAALNQLGEMERKAYVLMERINAPIAKSTLLVEQTAEEVNTVSEIGRYAACFFNGETIQFNQDIGYLVRTKSSDQNEGGVCAGYACLNSLCAY